MILKRVPYQLLVPARSPLKAQLGACSVKPFLPAGLLKSVHIVLGRFHRVNIRSRVRGSDAWLPDLAPWPPEASVLASDGWS